METTALIVSVAPAASPPVGAFPQKPLRREPGQSTARRGRHNATNGINGAVSASPLQPDMPKRASCTRPARSHRPANAGEDKHVEASSHQTRSPTRSGPSRPAPPTPRTPSTIPAAARKGQGQSHDDAAAEQSLARRSAGAKTLAASPNFATTNRETDRSCGESLSPREAGDGSLVLRSRGQDLYSRARGVQSVIDGRLPNVDERSISPATGPRSRLKRPPAVRRGPPRSAAGRK